MRKFMLLFAIGLLCGAVFAQATRGSLSGLVSDANNAAVPAARIAAKHATTGEEFRGTTDAQGAFIFPSLPPGQYTITVEASGFKQSEVQAVTVEVGTTAKLNLPLEVGAINEVIVVTGEVQEVVNTSNPTLTNVIGTRQVKDLPLPTRNPLDLARLQAGIAVSGTNTRTANVGGLRGSATNVTQDGINAMDNFVKTDSFFAMSSPSLDSISEFSITVGTVGSDAGRGAAQVNMVTKSGTNEFHGRVFYQIRNDALNANTFFNNATNTPRTILRQSWFGGNIGGPLWFPKKAFGPLAYDGRSKSLWFFSYEGFRQPFSVTRNRTVLTAEARRGLFRYVGANGQQQTLNLLDIGNFKTLNPVTGAQLNAMPMANNTLVGDALNTAGYRYNVKGSSPNEKYVGRFDQQLWQNSRLGSHKLEFVYNYFNFLSNPDTFNGLEAPFPGGIGGFQSAYNILTTAAIHSVFGSRMTNEVRAGHQRAPVGFLREAPPDTPFFITFPGTANLDQVTAFHNTFMSSGRNTLVYQYLDNFTRTQGAHTFRLGGDVQSITAITFNDLGIQQTIAIGSNPANNDGILATAFPNLPAGATGTAIVNRARNIYAGVVGLLGTTSKTFNVTSPTSGFVPGATRTRDFKQREVSLYFQDQWRVKRNFTFNYGMRWEFQGVPYEVNGVAIQPAGGIGGLFGISGPNNLFKPGTLTGPAATPLEFVNGNTGKKLYNNDGNNFAPFIGLAYSPNFERGPLHWVFGKDGKSSIRAGFSISYLHDGFSVVSNALGTGTTNPGLIQVAANNTPTGVLTAGGLALATPTFKIPITDAENFALNNTNGLWTFDPNLRVPYVQQWSLGIERQIADKTAFEVRYVGNHAIKVFRAINYNEVNIFENGFLPEFLNAQNNLRINGGATFAPGRAGTAPTPIFDRLFAGLAAGSGYASAGFINNLNNNNVGTMANTLAFNPVYANTRRSLTPNFFVANPNAAFAVALTNNSFSNYHSLQVEIRRRLAQGLQFQGSYTFSKVITDSEGSQSTLESFRTLRNLRLDRHRANFDQTHRFVSFFLYSLPVGPGRRWLNSGPLRKALEGWDVSGIISIQSGAPLSIFAPRTTLNQITNSIPALFTGSNFKDFKNAVGVVKRPEGIYYIDPKLLNITTNAAGQITAATLKEGLLAQPLPGTLGNFPRSQLTGPIFRQVDFSVTKRTKFLESAEVEFKATFFNAFNYANFAFSNQNFDQANFGRITGLNGSARIIHFILGINF